MEPTASFAKRMAYVCELEKLETPMAFLEQLQLPVPESDSFMDSRRGIIMFHPTAAIALRFCHKEKSLPHVLVDQPIAEENLGEVTGALYKGVRNNTVTHDDVEWLLKELKRDGIHWADAKPSNVGLMPIRTEDHPRGIPFVRDPDDLHYTLRGHALRLFRKPPTPEDNIRKLQSYGAPLEEAVAWVSLHEKLGEAYRQAWPNRKENAEPERIRAFWRFAEACTVGSPEAPANPKPMLVRGWDDPPCAETAIDPHVPGRGNGMAKAERAHLIANAYRRQNGLPNLG